MRLFVIIFCLLSYGALSACATLPHAKYTHVDTLASDSIKKANKLQRIYNGIQWYMKYFPVPYASYSVETSWLIGVTKFNAFTFKKGDKSDTITQPSSVNFFSYLTGNKQYKASIETNFMFHHNKTLWKTTLLYADYPLEFFGTGNNTQLENQQTLVSRDWQLSSYYLFKVWRKWYVGPSFDFYKYNKVEIEAEDNVDPPFPDIDMSHNLGKQSGLGLKVLMEGRDNRLNARSGFYVEGGYQVFREGLGSEYHYNYFLGDVRYYFTPLKKLTIATRIRSEAKTGNVPVQSLAFIGGDYSTRGTYEGRYRDHVSMESELELRFPIYWIFGGVVFNSIGQVAPSYSQIRMPSFHYNYGFGLRVNVDQAHDVNLRFDLGFSSDQTIFVINFGEAF